MYVYYDMFDWYDMYVCMIYDDGSTELGNVCAYVCMWCVVCL